MKYKWKKCFRIAVATSVTCMLGITSLPATALDKYAKDASQATDKTAVEYWYDGKKKRQIIMDANIIASFDQQQDIGRDVTGNIRGGIRLRDVSEIGGSREVLGSRNGNLSPLFYSSSGGQRRALPGGVIVSLDKSWSREQAMQWLAQRNLSVRRELAIANTFLVVSPAGRTSLDLANRLFESGEVTAASPNWWVEMHTR